MEEKVNINPSEVNKRHWEDEWSVNDINKSMKDHVLFSWGPSDAMREGALLVSHGKGVKLYDQNGKDYIDFSSQAIGNNLGHEVPKEIVTGINKQLSRLPFVQGGLCTTEIRARMGRLMNEVSAPDLTGWIFTCSGNEANEFAIRVARLQTGRHKIMTRYRSQHGGSTSTLAATGDFRRNWGEMGAHGFVKCFDPMPLTFRWGSDTASIVHTSLAALEEQIVSEGSDTIAALLLESVPGSAGALQQPEGYMQGVRALCDRYGIQLIMDEAQFGFGRGGKMFGYQLQDGVVPDIVTMCKGMSGCFLPLGAAGISSRLHEHFRKNPTGWGATFQAHPTSLAAGYSTIKYILDNDLLGNVNRMGEILQRRVTEIADKYDFIRQVRCRGLFACFDLVDEQGKSFQRLQDKPEGKWAKLKTNIRANGLSMWVRFPLLKVAPPLIINKEDLLEGLNRLDNAFSSIN